MFKLLILDDEPLILMDLEWAGEDAGCAVKRASTGQQALDHIHSGVDVAILDVMLARGETSEPVARRLTDGGIPFVLHTGGSANGNAALNRMEGEVITKPAPARFVVERALAIATRTLPALAVA